MRPVILRRPQIFWQAWLFIWLQGKWKSRVVKTQPRLRWRKDSKVVKHLALFIFTSSPYIWIYLWKWFHHVMAQPPIVHYSSKSSLDQLLFFSFRKTFWFDYIRRSAQRDFFIITFILFTSLAICILSFSVESLPRSIMSRSILVLKITCFSHFKQGKRRCFCSKGENQWLWYIN